MTYIRQVLSKRDAVFCSLFVKSRVDEEAKLFDGWTSAKMKTQLPGHAEQQWWANNFAKLKDVTTRNIDQIERLEFDLSTDFCDKKGKRDKPIGNRIEGPPVAGDFSCRDLFSVGIASLGLRVPKDDRKRIGIFIFLTRKHKFYELDSSGNYVNETPIETSCWESYCD